MRAAFGGAFRGARVFLTGHTGFKGSWLALWLAELGAEVTGFSLAPPTRPSLFEEAEVSRVLADDLRGDVRDAGRLASAVEAARPDFVFHLAAQPLVRLSYDTPAETFAVNVMGAVNLLEAVRRAPSVRSCVVVTSDKCYENREWEYAYREDDAMGGHDPYSASKGAAELAVASWRRSFFSAPEATGVATARAGNVIGGGDWAEDRLLPDCVRAWEGGETVTLRNPGAVRPWQHVLEPLSGYLHLAARLAEDRRLGGPWNFGPLPSDALTVEELVAEASRRWEGARFRVAPPSKAPHEAGLLRLDCTRAATRLGWRPAWGIREALEATMGWYRARREGKAPPASLCREQVAAYAGAARRAGAPWTGEEGS